MRLTLSRFGVPRSTWWNLPLLAAGVIVAGLGMGLLSATVHGQIAVRNQGYVPFSEEPINYRAEVNDPVAQLQRRLAVVVAVAVVHRRRMRRT